MEDTKMSDDENEPMEVIDDSNESEESSESDGEEEQAQNRRAEELEQQISNNKYLYDAHIEVIDIYRKLGDLKSMREAYQRFQEIFPLTPKLWLAWIKDEIKLATTPAEKKNIFDLFAKAVEDYLSVELWVEYAQYAIGASDLQTTREILEKGLTYAGLHATQGSLLWDTWRELEFAHLSVAPPESDQYKEQIKRVLEVFKRQLSLPLMDMENTYHEFQEFLKTLPADTAIDAEAIEWRYKSALKTLDGYKPYEERLLMAEEENEIYGIYKQYIEAVSNPPTKICLYERAVASVCLNPNLWYDYCLYTFSSGDAALSVSKRALRNIPWSEELWSIHLRILERNGKDVDKIKEIFEQGIASVSPPALELWLTYLEYMVRNAKDKEKVDKLFMQASQQVGRKTDPTAKICRFHAKILAKQGDMHAARKIWNSIVNRPENKGAANIWLEYANLEKQYGEPQQLRNLYQKALSSCKDWAHYIAEEWMFYERENGTLEDVVKCIQKCKPHMSIQQPTQQVEEYEETEHHSKGKKRKYDNARRHDNETKKPKQGEQHKNETVPPKPVKKRIPRDPTKTVFVSNLHPKVTEDKLKEFFPSAVDVDLVLDRKGNSRCYGYVQFQMEEEVMHALARDREQLDGRPIFISNCKPDKNERKPVFKYAEAVEKNKLFIRGLPLSKTKEDIEEIFKPHNATEVRLVTRKNGQSKGLAYIQFPDEDSAQKALEATNQMNLDGHTITVAISAPPPKKNVPISEKDIKEPVRHARSKLSVSLIPRQLQVKNNASSTSTTDTANAANKTVQKAQKTNEDFRKMLLRK